MSRWLPLLLILGVLARGGLAQEPLREAAAIRALPREEAAKGHAVELRGVVTFSQGASCVLHDASAGIYVTFGSAQKHGRTLDFAGAAEPAIGMLLSVSGITVPGGYAPAVQASDYQVLGEATLPSPVERPLAEVLTGALDCQIVRVRGVVQRSYDPPGDTSRVRLDLAALEGRFSAFLANPRGIDTRTLVDSEVQLTGVCFTQFSPRGEAASVYLQVADAHGIEIERPAGGDPFAVPDAPLLALRPFSATLPNLHRQKLRGVVTLARPGEFLFVQTAERGVRVNVRDNEQFAPGELVEASGFARPTSSFAVLSDAELRRLGHGQLPAPIPITRAQVLGVGILNTNKLRQEDYDGTLARLRARLVKVESNAGEDHRLFLESDGAIVVANLGRAIPAEALAGFAPGSEVEVTGICTVKLATRWPVLAMPAPEDFTLMLQSPDSVRVLRAPSWWTPRRLWTALGITAGVLAFSLAWVWTLRRRVARRSAALAAEMRARRDAAVEFETTLRERTRLAADLHDTLEQSLTGLALQLEAADALQTEAPAQSGQHLGLARQLLDRSREDVRRSVWELRANPLEGNTLTAALRCIAADRSAGLAVRISVESEGEPQPLPDFVAGNLLLLAQEGITNALKHAVPQQITLHLAFTKDEVSLRIRDDGRGFTPSEAPGPREGHFGLQGMRERAKRLGGQLTIDSAPSHGTAITISLPPGACHAL